MFKRIVCLSAAVIFVSGLAFAGGEGEAKAGAGAGGARKATAKSSVKRAADCESYEPGVPYTKKRDDLRIVNEHGHHLEALFYPPQSHNYMDLDTPPSQMLNRNVRILRTTNKAQLNRYVPVVYNLKNVNPFAVVRWVRRTVQHEEGAVFTFVGPGANNGKMLVAVPEYQICYLNDLVATIDRANLTSSDGTKRIYRQLKHRRANISDDERLDDSAFINTFAIYLTDNGANVIVDPEQNAVFYQDAPSGSDYLDAALTSTLDKPTPQAVLNTKIYEMDMSNNARIGLDYIAWKNGPGANLFAFGAFNEVGSVNFRDGATAILDNSNGIGSIPDRHTPQTGRLKGDFRSNGDNFAYRYEMNSAFFDYLVTKGKARNLNSAKVAALNTRSATISAADQVLYYQVQTVNPSPLRPGGDKFAANRGRTVIGTTEEVVDGELTPVEVGLELNLTPLIYENGLDVSIDGSMTDYNGFDDTGYPRINSRDFATSVRMNVGEETVLGGLMRESQVKAGNKMPILGKIPILGYLFGGENTRRSKKEIVVAITAEQIVRYDGKGYGINADDKSVLDQGEGSKKVEGPKTTWGFDMLGLDKER